MHNLKTNFDKLYRIVKSSLSDKLNEEDNLQFYPRLPKLNDCSIIALSICCESLGIDWSQHVSSSYALQGEALASTNLTNFVGCKTLERVLIASINCMFILFGVQSIDMTFLKEIFRLGVEIATSNLRQFGYTNIKRSCE